jgi:hypothetical protein
VETSDVALSLGFGTLTTVPYIAALYVLYATGSSSISADFGLALATSAAIAAFFGLGLRATQLSGSPMTVGSVQKLHRRILFGSLLAGAAIAAAVHPSAIVAALCLAACRTADSLHECHTAEWVAAGQRWSAVGLLSGRSILVGATAVLASLVTASSTRTALCLAAVAGAWLIASVRFLAPTRRTGAELISPIDAFRRFWPLGLSALAATAAFVGPRLVSARWLSAADIGVLAAIVTLPTAMSSVFGTVPEYFIASKAAGRHGFGPVRLAVLFGAGSLAVTAVLAAAFGRGRALYWEPFGVAAAISVAMSATPFAVLAQIRGLRRSLLQVRLASVAVSLVATALLTRNHGLAGPVVGILMGQVAAFVGIVRLNYNGRESA